ncbi:MAG TPA: hypothetical protein VN682_20480 [Terriglobales bacterium]|nr:hypothetical protein [Terriglobales bacterium]
MKITISRVSNHSAAEGSLRQTLAAYDAEALQHISRIFWWLAERLGNQTPSEYLLRQSPLASRLDHLDRTDDIKSRIREYVEQHRQNAQLDYGLTTVFTYFDRAYFYRNFLKCLIGGHYLGVALSFDELPQRVIDLGSGVGTFALACKLLHIFPDADFLLVDKHRFQLELAQGLMARLELSGFEVLRADVFSAFGKQGFLIASYWLCGNRRDVLERPISELRSILKHGLALIDYRSNLDEFVGKIMLLRPRLHLLEIRAPLPHDMSKLVGSRDLNVHMLIVEPLQS